MWTNGVQRFLLAATLLLAVDAADATRHEQGNPYRIWGDISSTYRARDMGSRDSSDTNWLNTGTINASSYIYRPWFALINGSLSLSVDETEVDEQPPVDDEFTTGRFQFDLFPSSRFPFTLFHLRYRSRLEDTFIDRDVTTTRTGLRQRYRSRDGKHNYRASYERDRQQSGEMDDFLATRLQLSAGNQVGRHAFQTDFEIDEVDERVEGDRAESFSFTELHTYRNPDNFSLENQVSTTRTENDFGDIFGDIDTAQVTSFLSWLPTERRNLRVTGSLRLSENRIFEQIAATQTMPPSLRDTETATANINQGLIYEYDDNLVLSESLNANYVENDGEILFIGSESVKAAYTAERRGLADGDYGWSFSSALTNQHGDIEARQELANQFRHSIAWIRSVKGAYQLRVGLTQALNYDLMSALPDERGLDHTASLTWSDSSTSNSSVISFIASESRTLDPEKDRFRLFNLQYSGAFRIDRYSRLSGNVTLQTSEQSNDDLRSRRTFSNGQLEYQRDRLIGVPNLLFRSQLRLSKQQSETERFIEDLSEDPGTETAWRNALHYRIGRLETQFNLDFVQLEDETDRLIKFHLKRFFGDL